MIKNAIELSDQYLSKGAMILIASLFIIIFGILIFIFIKSKKVKFRYLTNILCLFLYLLTFSFLLNYGLKSNIITKNFWDITGGYNTYGFSYSFFNSAINTGMHKPTGYSKNTIKAIPSLAYTLKDLGYSANSLHNHEGKFYSRNVVYKNLGFDSFTPIECMNVPERTPVGWAKDSVLIDEICNIITSTDNPDLVFGISVQGHGNYPNDEVDDKEIYNYQQVH